MTDADRELQSLLHTLKTSAPSDAQSRSNAVQRIENLVQATFQDARAGLSELVSNAPHWQHDVQKLEAGQDVLLRQLANLRATAEDPSRSEEFQEWYSRWLSHYRVHEHLENRMLQLSCMIDVGGEGGA